MVSCVSDGIADRLVDAYRLPERPLVIRNLPKYSETPWRARSSRAPIRMLYHGVVAPGRGLEAAIASAAHWRTGIELSIRGPAEPGYLATLRDLVLASGVSDRIAFLPPVPMTELVAAARAFDVGFFALAGDTEQNRYVLPNKLFEYVMAGLALCVSDLPEMARVLRAFDLGVLIADLEPRSIAAAVNGLDDESLERYRRNALTAARELCWEREAEGLVTACARIVG